MPVPLDKGDVDSGYEIRFTQVVELSMGRKPFCEKLLPVHYLFVSTMRNAEQVIE